MTGRRGRTSATAAPHSGAILLPRDMATSGNISWFSQLRRCPWHIHWVEAREAAQPATYRTALPQDSSSSKRQQCSSGETVS